MRTEAKSSTLADGVAQNLLGYIRKENLVPGDLLPKEEELAAQLNVSRHIIREGVSRLKAFGLVESRKCRGTVVSRPNAFAGMHRLAQAELFSVEEWKEECSPLAHLTTVAQVADEYYGCDELINFISHWYADIVATRLLNEYNEALKKCLCTIQ